MAKLKVGIFSLLLVILLSIFFVVLYQEELPVNSLAYLSGHGRFRGKNMLFEIVEFWHNKRESSTSPQNTKTDVTSGRDFVTKPKSSPEDTPIPMLSLKAFQRLPQWDFDDIYNQDSPPKPNTCPQSLRKSKDEVFQKAFLPNIRLFMHRYNFNMKEWNRLSHFNNPFGFMQMKYDEVWSAVKLIPKPIQPLLLPKPGGDGCVHCAVVGSGGILYGSKMGAEIDAHDYVFRMNAAVIKGYEEDVGNKTSVYVHTSFSITQSPIIFSPYGYRSAPHDEGIKYVLIPEGLRDFHWLKALIKGEKISDSDFQNENPRAYYSGQYNMSRFYVLHQDFMRYVRNRFLKSGYLNDDIWSIVRPTNGAFTLFLALHTCDTVSAYGFMTDNYAQFSNYYAEKQSKRHSKQH
uniref:alpha-N-acetylgalactosaminide alpha-2,6-sialyltransferase n=1 Tax=Nothobranchius furzeri TaxID=105023 RepID=A0A8C6KYX1_NOTFU